MTAADKTQTPRTEEMIDSCGDYEKAYRYQGRFANFARQLERELAAKTRELAEAKAEGIKEERERCEAIFGHWPYQVIVCAEAIRAIRSAKEKL